MITNLLRAATPVAAFFFAACASLLPLPAQASAKIAVEPLALKLPAQTLAASVSVRSKDTKPVTFQAEVLAWSQQDGKDVLTPTRELVVSPPIFRIAPGDRQVVRVGRLKAEAVPAIEKTYRLSLTEIVPEGQARIGAIGTAIKVTLPVFVPPARPQATSLRWQAARSGDDLRLGVSNSGNTTARLIGLNLLQQGRPVAAKDTLLYVLPGSNRSVDWPKALREARPGQPLELLTVFGNRKSQSQPLDFGVVSVVPVHPASDGITVIPPAEPQDVIALPEPIPATSTTP